MFWTRLGSFLLREMTWRAPERMRLALPCAPSAHLAAGGTYAATRPSLRRSEGAGGSFRCIHLTLTRVATVSVPIVADTCARKGAGFSRFLQLVPGDGESQTTGKLCVLHFWCQAFDTTLFSSGWPVATTVHTIELRTSNLAHGDNFRVITHH